MEKGRVDGDKLRLEIFVVFVYFWIRSWCRFRDLLVFLVLIFALRKLLRKFVLEPGYLSNTIVCGLVFLHMQGSYNKCEHNTHLHLTHRTLGGGRRGLRFPPGWPPRTCTGPHPTSGRRQSPTPGRGSRGSLQPCWSTAGRPCTMWWLVSHMVLVSHKKPFLKIPHVLVC